MTKMNGLGMSVTVDDSGGTGRDISNDIQSVSLKTSSGVQDVTGLDKSAIERILLQADAEVVLTMTYNPAANKQHSVFKDYRTLAAAQVGRTTALAGTNMPTISMEILYSSYNMARDQKGTVIMVATGSLADGTVPTFS